MTGLSPLNPIYFIGQLYSRNVELLRVLCRVQDKTGDKACPFNLLYWHFWITDRFSGNTDGQYVPRLGPDG
jgi:hypothetical protein